MYVQNIVATAKTNRCFNLETLYNVMENNGVSPSKRDRWLSIRLKGSNQYIAFYKSGKFLIAGVKSEKEIEATVKRVAKTLYEMGIKIEIENIEIHNVIVMEQFVLSQSLENIQISLLNSADVSFEPEVFPGLIYKGDRATFLLFSSGKVICTGCKSLEIAEIEIKKFKNKIKNL